MVTGGHICHCYGQGHQQWRPWWLFCSLNSILAKWRRRRRRRRKTTYWPAGFAAGKKISKLLVHFLLDLTVEQSSRFDYLLIVSWRSTDFLKNIKMSTLASPLPVFLVSRIEVLPITRPTNHADRTDRERKCPDTKEGTEGTERTPVHDDGRRETFFDEAQLGTFTPLSLSPHALSSGSGLDKALYIWWTRSISVRNPPNLTGQF